MGHVRENLNPLAADDHMKEVIQQLQLMGEVSHFSTLFSITQFIPHKNTHVESYALTLDRLCT